MNDDTSALEIHDQGRASAGARRLSEWTDTPVTGFPKLETRHLPFMERLRLRWLSHSPRGGRRQPPADAAAVCRGGAAGHGSVGGPRFGGGGAGGVARAEVPEGEGAAVFGGVGRVGCPCRSP